MGTSYPDRRSSASIGGSHTSSVIIVFTCVIAIAVIGFILMVRPKDLPEPEPISPFQHLDERKAAIYENLRDLQFEYRLDKLSDADYQATKLELQKDLAHVLAETDRIKSELGIQTTVASPAPRKKNVCPSCGASFPNALKFCGECGKPMGASA